MGKPSDKRRLARRPGKRERARVKKQRRSSITTYVPGAGTVRTSYGRKKLRRALAWAWRDLDAAHLCGEPVKPETE